MNKKNYLKVLSENILILRKKKGLTQESLADRLAVSFQAVSKWENGQCSPDISALPLLAEIFEVSIDELFGIESKNIASLPWNDDNNVIRGVVYKGKKLLGFNYDNPDDLSNFTFSFKFENEILNIESGCNINCGNIEGNVNAGGNVNCGNIACDANAGGNVNCGNIACDANAGGSIYCNKIFGDASAGMGINHN